MPSDDVVPAPFVEAVFACAKCGRQAARVSVRPRGMPRPSPGRDLLPLDLDRVVIEAGQLSTSMGGSAIDAAIPAVLRALGDSDGAALFAADFELAPFWCPTCGSSYCGDEWVIWTVYDEGDPEWIDELRGRCPVGHERMLQD
jgi:hypothetical protein